MKPLISCIMSNYNTEPAMFRTALESILNQTLGDFELILIDDKSTQEESRNVIEEYEKKDTRIIAIYNDQNMGLAGALNEGLKVAKGKYIARFDTDDICVNDRFEKQVIYMEKYKVDVCSTFAHLFGAYEDVVATSFYSCEDVAVQLLFSCYIYHTPVMMRNEFLKAQGLRYDVTFDGAEDFDLFTRCRERGAKICIMPEIMFHYRIHDSSVCHTQKPKQIKLSKQICKRQLDWMGVIYSVEEWNAHLILCGLDTYTEEKHEILKRWCEKLIYANKEGGFFDINSFSRVIYNRFLSAVIKSELSRNEKVRISFKDKRLFSRTNLYSVVYKKLFTLSYYLRGRNKECSKMKENWE